MRRCLRLTQKSSYYEPYQLSMTQRALLVPYFAFGALSDPTRGDLVAALGDSTAQRALKNLHVSLSKSNEGRELLKEKPLISSTNLPLATLAELPANTLGKQYANYMESHNFFTDERSVVKFMTDPELAYIMVRYRQVHDFWHVLCDLPPTILGEVSLKWFEYYVTGLPICWISGVFGPLKLPLSEVSKLNLTYLPWAKRSGERCDHTLLSFRYEDHLHVPVDTLRKQLGIEAAPK